MIDAIVYIYLDEAEARAGAPRGATGCLISYEYKTAGLQRFAHLYVVTNAHVAVYDKPCYVRINLRGGGTEVFSFQPDAWVRHPESDVAAAAVTNIKYGRLRLGDIATTLFVTREQVKDDSFGVGDECLFIGRHHGLDGKARNTPAARFGAVSIIDPEPVRHDILGRAEESIAVEARSLSGFSGSPVFVWKSGPILPPVYKDILREGRNSLIGQWPLVVHSRNESPFAFLGITWGHMEGRTAVAGPGSSLSRGEKALAVNSGIMLVVPAWKVLELFEMQGLPEIRERRERETAQRETDDIREGQAIAHLETDWRDDEEGGCL